MFTLYALFVYIIFFYKNNHAVDVNNMQKIHDFIYSRNDNVILTQALKVIKCC